MSRSWINLDIFFHLFPLSYLYFQSFPKQISSAHFAVLGAEQNAVDSNRRGVSPIQEASLTFLLHP